MFVQQKLTLSEIHLLICNGMFLFISISISHARSSGDGPADCSVPWDADHDKPFDLIEDVFQLSDNSDIDDFNFGKIIDILNADPRFLRIANDLRRYDAEGYPSAYLLDTSKASYVARHGGTLVALSLTTESKVKDVMEGLKSYVSLMRDHMEALVLYSPQLEEWWTAQRLCYRYFDKHVCHINRSDDTSLKHYKLRYGADPFNDSLDADYTSDGFAKRRKRLEELNSPTCNFINTLEDFISNKKCSFYKKYFEDNRFKQPEPIDFGDSLHDDFSNILDGRILVIKESQKFLSQLILNKPIAAVLFAMEPSFAGNLRGKVVKSLTDELVLAAISFRAKANGNRLELESHLPFLELVGSAFTREFPDPYYISLRPEKMPYQRLHSFVEPLVLMDFDFGLLNLIWRVSEVYFVELLNEFFSKHVSTGKVNLHNSEVQKNLKEKIIVFVKEKLWPFLRMQNAIVEKLHEEYKRLDELRFYNDD